MDTGGERLMCEKCIPLLAAQDQASAAHRTCIREGTRWAMNGLLAGQDPTDLWAAMAKSMLRDSECTRSNFAHLLAAAYVTAAQELLPQIEESPVPEKEHIGPKYLTQEQADVLKARAEADWKANYGDRPYPRRWQYPVGGIPAQTSVTVRCPACGTAIHVPITITSERVDGQLNTTWTPRLPEHHCEGARD
jgi:hypothetical protein